MSIFVTLYPKEEEKEREGKRKKRKIFKFDKIN